VSQPNAEASGQRHLTGCCPSSHLLCLVVPRSTAADIGLNPQSVSGPEAPHPTSQRRAGRKCTGRSQPELPAAGRRVPRGDLTLAVQAEDKRRMKSSHFAEEKRAHFPGIRKQPLLRCPSTFSPDCPSVLLHAVAFPPPPHSCAPRLKLKATPSYLRPRHPAPFTRRPQFGSRRRMRGRTVCHEIPPPITAAFNISPAATATSSRSRNLRFADSWPNHSLLDRCYIPYHSQVLVGAVRLCEATGNPRKPQGLIKHASLLERANSKLRLPAACLDPAALLVGTLLAARGTRAVPSSSTVPGLADG
jgi:hypothetical protein